MRVKAVSKNFFIMVRNHFGKPLYSICDKNPSTFNRNYIEEGYPTIEPDAWVFGKYDYFNQEDINRCLHDLEEGIDSNKWDKTELSVRRSCALKGIQYKRA